MKPKPHGKAPGSRAAATSAADDFGQALALHQQGQIQAAMPLYERVLKRNPGHFDALHLGGLLLHQSGQSALGADWMRRALRINPASAVAHHNLALALLALNEPAAALAACEAAIARRSDYANAHRCRGDALQQLGRHAEAVDSYTQALNLQPQDTQAWFNRGNALWRLGQLAQALGSYDAALGQGPCGAELWTARGRVQGLLGRPEEAAQSYQQAVRLRPDDVASWRALGRTLSGLEQHAPALEALERALALDGDTEERMSLGLYRLHLGDLPRGWADQKARRRLPVHTALLTRFDQTPWPAADAAPAPFSGPDDGRLLVWGEEGLGDQILHLGMLPSLLDRVAQVSVAVERRLIPLVQRSFPAVEVVDVEQPQLQSPARYQVPMSGLGPVLRPDWHHFGDTRLAYLKADPDRVRALRLQLAPGNQRLCGLSWRSGNELVGAERTVPLAEWQQVLAVPGYTFVDLQYGDTQAERAAAAHATGVAIGHVQEVDNTTDIDGLAALMTACDVVVTVANTTAHLAAALGRPVLQLLPRTRGVVWYWHEGRDDSPWYPTLRQVRRRVGGDWQEVLQRVATALAQGWPDRTAD